MFYNNFMLINQLHRNMRKQRKRKQEDREEKIKRYEQPDWTGGRNLYGELERKNKI